MNNFNYDLIKLQLYQLENDFNAKMDKLKKEIIEEDKKIEKLPYYSLERIQKAPTKDTWFDEKVTLLEKRVDDYYNKINELINEVSKLKEKINNE